MRLAAQQTRNLVDVVRLERRAFAAKIRFARAMLCWTQGELAGRVGLTQRAIHKLEQGETEPRRATIHAIEQVWREEGLDFEDAGDGFRLVVQGPLIDRPNSHAAQHHSVRRDLGVTKSSYLSYRS
jgi:transcriptional regulator with XRE-family HTH domain